MSSSYESFGAYKSAQLNEDNYEYDTFGSYKARKYRD